MKERDDELEDLFRERFSEKEAPVSPRVWNNIKNSLPPEGDNKKPFWKKPITFFGIVAGSLLTGAVLWWAISSGSQKNDQLLSDELTIEQRKNEREEKLNKNTNEIKHSENKEDHKSENLTNTETTDGIDQKTGNSFDEKNQLIINNEVKTKSNKDVNIDADEQNNSDNIRSSVLQKELNTRKKGNNLSNTSGKKGKAEPNTTGVSNESDDHKNSSQKRIIFGDENNQTKKNLTMSESAQKGKKNGAIVNDDKNDTDPEVAKKDDNTNNPIISVANQNLNNETYTSDKNPTVRDKKKNQNGNDKNTSNVNQNSSHETSSDENSISREQEKNQNELAQNDRKEQKTETIQNSSITTVKANEKLHELSRDSSVSSIQKEHTPIEKNVDDNTKSNTDKVIEDSITNAPVIVKISPDSIKPIVDTLANTKMDSTVIADSTEKKEKERKPNRSRWSVDLLVGPMITGAATQANDLSYERVVNAKNQQDKNQFNVTGGGMVNYSLSSRFYISTGILYTGYSEKYTFKNTKENPTITSYIKDDSAKIGQDTIYTHFPTTVYDTTLVTKEYSDKKKDHYSFVSMPLNISIYLWRREKIALLATAGIRANLIMKNTTYVSNDSLTGLIEYSERAQKVTFSYMASVAMEYQLKNRMYLLVQPTFNYQAGSIYSKSAALNQKPYSVGMNVGLRIKF